MPTTKPDPTPRPPDHVWVHPDVVVGTSGIEGQGLFVRTDLAAGTAVVRLGGQLVDTTELERRLDAALTPGGTYVDSITVDEDRHLILPSGSPAHYGNHSCDPTLWHHGPFELVARRALAAGEELTVDYGTSSGAPGFSMACRCGSPTCRGVVTSHDWQRPELQATYAGHWTPALAARIERSGRHAGGAQ